MEINGLVPAQSKFTAWYLYKSRVDVSFIDPLADEMFQCKCASTVYVGHKVNELLGNGEGTSPLGLIVALEVHLTVRVFHCFAFVLVFNNFDIYFFL